MATSKINKVEVEKIMTVTENHVTLTLDADEAQVIADLLYFVGGPTRTSRRKYADRVSNALHYAGYYRSKHDDVQGGIYFENSGNLLD